jgi:KDO2-lipid IV(A) lauroyltransferase
VFAWILYVSGGWLSGKFPRWFGLRVTSLIAVFFRWTHPGTVAAVSANLRQIEAGMGRPFDPLMVPEVFQHFARSVYEFISLPHQSSAQILERFRIVRGGERLTKAGGEGLLVVSAHLAGWELGGAWLAQSLGPFHTVALEHPSARVSEYFSRRRAKRGITVHPLGQSYRTLLQALRAGETVVLLCDRSFSRSARTLDFFGRPAEFPDGYLRLAAEAGVPVLPLFARRVGSVTEIRIEESFRVTRDTVDSSLKHVVGLLEHHVGRAPEQWARFTPVWEDGGDV